jgi:hypothetical protein
MQSNWQGGYNVPYFPSTLYIQVSADKERAQPLEGWEFF